MRSRYNFRLQRLNSQGLQQPKADVHERVTRLNLNSNKLWRGEDCGGDTTENMDARMVASNHAGDDRHDLACHVLLHAISPPKFDVAKSRRRMMRNSPRCLIFL